MVADLGQLDCHQWISMEYSAEELRSDNPHDQESESVCFGSVVSLSGVLVHTVSTAAV